MNGNVIHRIAWKEIREQWTGCILLLFANQFSGKHGRRCGFGANGVPFQSSDP